jgi:hypothetical protein
MLFRETGLMFFQTALYSGVPISQLRKRFPAGIRAESERIAPIQTADCPLLNGNSANNKSVEKTVNSKNARADIVFNFIQSLIYLRTIKSSFCT